MTFKSIKEEIRDVKKSMEHIYGYAMVGENFLNQHDCNDCSIQTSCDYAPAPGDTVRSNCPLWMNEEVTAVKGFKPVNTTVHIIFKDHNGYESVVCVCNTRKLAFEKKKEYEKADSFSNYIIECWKVWEK